MFPNFSVIKTNSHSLRVWHPKGPDSIEIWAWAFTDKAAPPEVKETIRKIAAYGFSPAGTFEQDDMDNWQNCTLTSRGVVARRQMLNYQMGLGHETWNPGLRGPHQPVPLQRQQPAPVLQALEPDDGRGKLGGGAFV